MKIYLCLLLISFLTCDLIDKRDEIILKDFATDFLDKMSDIINYACGEDTECVLSHLEDIVSKFNSDESNKYSEFIKSDKCYDTCSDYLKDKIYSYKNWMEGWFCFALC